jgi:hypothetical protein
MFGIKRREFITLLGGVAAWPFGARAQQAGKLPTIGYLHTGSQQVWRPFIDAFVRGLRTEGYTEGQNVQIEYRWAEGALDAELRKLSGGQRTFRWSGRQVTRPLDWPPISAITL